MVTYIIVMIITGAVAVSKLLVGNCTLQELNVNDNIIGDDGISVIVEQLQHITTLTVLNVGYCGLSVKGIVLCIICINISPEVRVNCNRIRYEIYPQLVITQV